MSFATTPAYIQSANGWEPRLREHPVLDWMIDYINELDNKDLLSKPYNIWHADDLTVTKENGETLSPGTESWAAVLELFAPLAAHCHEAVWAAIWETPNGWGFVGHARIFANLLLPGEQTKTDLSGRKWDILIQGMYQFDFVRDATGHKGLKLRAEKVFFDPSQMLGLMVKRGMLSPEELVSRLS